MRIPTPVSALARNDSASRCRDVGDAVPYEGGRTDPRTGVRRGTWAPPYGAQRSCGADRVARRDGISAGTRAVEHQGTHRGRGQRRATAHRGKLWRHNPLNRKNRKTGCAWDRSARNHSRRARGSLETQFQAAFLVTFVAADKSHPPEAKKGGSAPADAGGVGDAVPYGITRGRVQEGGRVVRPCGRGCGFPRQCAHWLGMTALRAVGTSGTPSPTRAGRAGRCGYHPLRNRRGVRADRKPVVERDPCVPPRDTH